MELLAHYKTVRERLRNPPNARPDDGIDLGRRPFAVPRIKHRLPPKPIPIPPKPIPIPATFIDGRPSIPSVIRAVSRAFGISMKHLCGEGRRREIVRPRHIAAALACRLTWTRAAQRLLRGYLVGDCPSVVVGGVACLAPGDVAIGVLDDVAVSGE